MFVSDQPSSPPSMPAVVMVAKGGSSREISEEHPHISGVCELLNLNGKNQVDAYPTINANTYFNTHKAKIDYATAAVSVLQQPKHGRLEPTNSDGDWRHARYKPKDGYRGKDFFALQVEGDGYKVKLYYFVLVTEDDGVQANPDCKTPGSWKISLSSTPLDPNAPQPLLSAVSTSVPASVACVARTISSELSVMRITGGAPNALLERLLAGFGDLSGFVRMAYATPFFAMVPGMPA